MFNLNLEVGNYGAVHSALHRLFGFADGAEKYFAYRICVPVLGTSSDDVLNGAPEDRNCILGLAGSDEITGDGSLTVRYGVPGTLSGSRDLLAGNSGDDTMFGDGKVNLESGGVGTLEGADDWLFGNGGDDDMYGDGTVYCSFADGTLHGGDDMIDAGHGDNTVRGDGTMSILRSFAVLSGGDDWIVARNGNDTLYGDGSARTLTGGDDTLASFAGDDVLWGDGEAWAILNGGDDRMLAGRGADILYGDGIANGVYVTFDAVLTGGNDQLNGGRGDDQLYGDGMASGAFVAATLAGGDDILRGGRGDDDMWGDGSVSTSGNTTATFVGGADTFVLRAKDGLDTIHDFRSSDGDTVKVCRTRLDWSDLDSNGSGVLDDGDAFVASDGTDTSIDLGAASGRSDAGLNVLLLLDTIGLTEDDFMFT
ncbi:calcium-binding protein [Tropicimonas isoalkanivorans]|uniref:Hemolysin-type calcium-binding repeat-containing protein n=1 Tax=Tropicimonas isoalkanivorans TaxID=441112 RepID=A0A1I1GAF1_9RHOB|nr:hypothetical protein [Tropicimonas isoalkanivorans]SFC08719.1 hypothetical protein SAMN04488094_102489 [Tropicimonas isoalkanivorans]